MCVCMINSISKMKFKIAVFFVLIACCLYSQKPTIFADKKEITGNILKAYENVEVIWKEYRFFADYVELNQKTNMLVAKGRVTISSADTVVSGDRLKFNMKDMTGEMYDTSGVMYPSIRYETSKWYMKDRETQKFKKLDFTSCSQCVPRWKITCRNGKVIKDKYIEMKNVILKIKNIPVFYFPWLRYPIRKDGRSTGFLFPVVVPHSERHGFTLHSSFFWDIRSNVDLTLNFDYYKKSGIGLSEEFRYLFRRMGGTIKYYYFKHFFNYNLKDDFGNEIKDDDGNPIEVNSFLNEEKSDYILKMDHKQSVDFLNTEIRVNVDRQSNPSLLTLHKKDFYVQKIRSYHSSVNITSHLSKIRLNVSASQRDTFYTTQNTSSTVKYLPSITAGLNRQKVWKLPGHLIMSGVSIQMDKKLNMLSMNSRFVINAIAAVKTCLLTKRIKCWNSTSAIHLFTRLKVLE